MTRHPQSLMTAALTLLALSNGALAQADFAEDFESNGADSANGPSNLVSRGWIFRNQCDPVVGAAWRNGDDFAGNPFEGEGFLTTDGLATDFFGGDYSVWAILPAIPGQTVGDEFSLWIEGGGSATYDTFLEVRYAPSGLETGSGPDDVGDFTDVLYTAELPIAASGYQRISAELPGSGRVAVRFHADYLSTFAGRGASISLDALTVGPPPAAPCGVPVPDAGDSVVWTASDGPYTICQDLLIPEGGEVLVEAGAEINFDAGTKLRVEGNLTALGTTANPVRFTGSTSIADGLEVGSNGQLEVGHGEIAVHVQAGGENVAAIFTDTDFIAGASIAGVPDIAVFERCDFTGASELGSFSGFAGTMRIVDCTFTDGAGMRIAGLMNLDNVTSTGSGLVLSSEAGAYPVLLENIEVTGDQDNPGLTLTGPNFLIGENVTLQDNLYPVALDGSGAGLLWGSMLPSSGNTNNEIRVQQFSPGPNREWADTGIPYVVQGGFPQNFGGSLIVEPGTNIKFGPGAGAFLVDSANLVLQGTAEEPIVLESLFPGAARWFGLKWVDDFDATARHTIFDGGEITVQSDGGVIDLINCTVSGSLEGTASVTGGLVNLLNSRIVNNNVGMVTTTSGRIRADGEISPSVFEGNAIAIDYNNTSSTPYLRYNWWGDASGPTSSLHPAGMGDTVQGVHPAAFTPFMTQAPSQTDEHPIVKMEPTYWFADAGSKIILRWSSTDDDAVVAHRIEFADHDLPSEFMTVANLPGDATTYEFDVPTVLPNNLYPRPSSIRIVATDSAGQESWDKSVLRIPYQEDWTVIQQDVSNPGLVHPHDNVDVCWSPGGNASVFVVMDGVGLSDSAGGSNTGCLPIGATLPYSSTDTARIVVSTTFGAGGRLHYSFSDYFPIRPDARFGDLPPAVDVTSPASDEQYPGGSVIPVRWTASDDDFLRSFTIQASYDGGRGWHAVASDLPADARAFDWRLPASTGIADVRLRVVAVDKRFQDSSSTTGAFTILPGIPTDCPADLVEPFGSLDFSDVTAFLLAFDAMDPAADLATPIGQFDFSDIAAFLTAFAAGCP